MTSPSKSALYVYNAENRLVRATVQSGNNVSIEEYKYDYAGNRIAKSSEGEYTKYLLDVNGELTYVLAEMNFDNTEKCYYTRGDELIFQERDGKKSYYVYDGHGSVRALADENGKVTDKYVYDAFGNLISGVGSTKNDFLFCGEQFDPVTGLYYLRARYMNPSVSRFITMDSYEGSIDDPVSLHKYLDANANPDTTRGAYGKRAILRYKSTKSITKNVMLFVFFIDKQYLASDKENDCINLTNILLSRFLYCPYGCRKYQNPFSCSSIPHGIFPACQKLCLSP